MMQRKVGIRVTGHEDGQTVMALLNRRFDYLSRDEWARHIADGRLFLNQSPASAHTRLRSGDRLAFHPPTVVEPPICRQYALVYEDAHLLAVDKPAHLPCHPAGRYFSHTLWYLLKTERGLVQPMFVNRIDRETSGIVLVAKTRDAARRCRREFDRGRVKKRYLAIVEGQFPRQAVQAQGYLYPDSASRVRKKRLFSPHLPPGPPPAAFQACCTTFRRRAVRGGLSLVEALPQTGRRHQIRASLCSLGYPIAGDTIYGVDDTLFLRFIRDELSAADRERLRLNRQALHAAEMHIRHPQSGRMLCLFSPLAADMQVLLAAAALRP